MEQYKEGIKAVGDSIGFGCMRVPVMILAIVTAILFLSCNDGGTPSGTTVDSTKTKPAKGDTSVFQTLLSNIPDVKTPTPGLTVEMIEGDNADHVQSMINNATARAAIYFPSGTFEFSKRLVIKNKSVWLIGSNGTKFIFKSGEGGILIDRDGSAFVYECKITDISIHNNGQVSGHGIEIHGNTYLDNVWIQGFPGDGVHISADVESEKTNASGSYLRNCNVFECGGNGYYFEKGDANAIYVMNCSASDNKGYGFWDNSFLGNNFLGSRCHANAKGHYKSDNGNNRTVFVGCYGEEDSPPSEFGGVTRVYGGLLGWEVTPDRKFYKGSDMTYRGSGGYVITSPYAKVDTQ